MSCGAERRAVAESISNATSQASGFRAVIDPQALASFLCLARNLCGFFSNCGIIRSLSVTIEHVCKFLQRVVVSLKECFPQEKDRTFSILNSAATIEDHVCERSKCLCVPHRCRLLKAGSRQCCSRGRLVLLQIVFHAIRVERFGSRFPSFVCHVRAQTLNRYANAPVLDIGFPSSK